MGNTVENEVQYFNFVDILRGIAALAVLIFHYQHFYCASPGSLFENKAIQPFYEYLEIIYYHGHIAVQLFWVISGFVFANVYFNRETTGKEFFVHRFARLHPLHFVTLCIIAIIQVTSMAVLGQYLILENTDWYHFILNVFMISNWGFETGYSFNGPFWSVSVEIFSYIVLYFSLKTLTKNRLVFSVFYTFLFLMINQHLPWCKSLTDCTYYFFLGTTVYGVVNLLKNKVGFIFLLSMACFAGAIYVNTINPIIKGDFVVSRDFFSLFLPGFVLLFSGLDCLPSLKSFGKRFKKIGDLSFSVYLCHLPLQMVVLIFIQKNAIDTSIFNHPISLLLFLSTVYLIAYFSYTYYENPMRVWIKNKFV